MSIVRSWWICIMASPVSLSSAIVDRIYVFIRFRAENERSLPAVDEGLVDDTFKMVWILGYRTLLAAMYALAKPVNSPDFAFSSFHFWSHPSYSQDKLLGDGTSGNACKICFISPGVIGWQPVKMDDTNFDAKAICCWLFPNLSASPCNRWSRKGINVVILKYSSTLSHGTFERPVCFAQTRGID